MTRTRSGKTVIELLVMFAVFLGLGGMLAHAVSKVRAAASSPPSQVEPRGGDFSVSLGGSSLFLAP